jgi:glycosyltransferase involved in cell wall biosynthesis
VLSVGSLEPGKNRRRLIEAFASLASAFPHTLAIAGQPAWKYEDDLSLPQRLGLTERVRFLGPVPDADLPALYSAAEAVAFPSLYEGFGLPALEAMACGAPLIASTAPALVELAGDAALLVDPYDSGAIAAALRRVLKDAELREKLRRRGLERAAQFSWRQAAEQTLAVYDQAAATRRRGT